MTSPSSPRRRPERPEQSRTDRRRPDQRAGQHRPDRRDPNERRPDQRRATQRDPRRRRAALSLETIVDAAIATLDREGADRLTLRGLAAELNSGVASLYWYASGKDELMSVVADELVGRALAEHEGLVDAGNHVPDAFTSFEAPAPDPRTSTQTASALREVRSLILCLVTQMLQHDWLAAQLLRSGPDQENLLMYWEKVGRLLQTMELNRTQQFHASLALVNYASGMGAEVSQRHDARDSAEEEDLMDRQVAEWDRTSEDRYPFIHSVLDEFRNHDDRSELVAGLDLLLSGVERQTWG